jgi:hypothetical protein
MNRETRDAQIKELTCVQNSMIDKNAMRAKSALNFLSFDTTITCNLLFFVSHALLCRLRCGNVILFKYSSPLRIQHIKIVYKHICLLPSSISTSF